MKYRNTAGRSELHIRNRELERRLKEDLKKYDIIYIHAPIGWGKYTFLLDFYDRCQKEKMYWLEEGEELSFAQQVEELPQEEKRMIIIPELERILERGQQELVWNLIAGKKKNDTFLISSAIPIPEELLPFSIFYRVAVYGVKEIAPSVEEVKTYFSEKGLMLSDEDFLYIKKDFRNMPLCLYLLENPLRKSAKGYCRLAREQCREDVFSYIDVVFFRLMPRADQDALLKLACFETLDENLISYILQMPVREVKELVRKLLLKGSILEPYKEGWKFEPLFRQFLSHAVHKYLDGETLLELYRKAMDYFEQQNVWTDALRFAYMLKNAERMAELLARTLKDRIDYNLFTSLDNYFLCLPQECLLRYPELLLAKAMQEAVSGNLKEAMEYEGALKARAEQPETEEEKRRLENELLCLHLVRPGGVEPEAMQEVLEQMSGRPFVQRQRIWNRSFHPVQLSVLHGNKDFCAFFMDGKDGTQAFEYVRKITEEADGSLFPGMASFLQAEVLYEYNRLDEALNRLTACLKETRNGNGQKMKQLCSVKIADLLIAKNQMESVDTFLVRQMEDGQDMGELFTDNFCAHQIYYCLLRNDREKILTWVKEQAPDEHGRFYSVYYYQYLMKAKTYIWMERYVLARMILQTLLDFARSYRMHYLELKAQLLEAVIYYLEGNSRWENALHAALKLGKRMKFIRVFADEGAAVYEPLQKFAEFHEDWAKDGWFKGMLSAARAQMLQYPGYMKQKKALDTGVFSGHEKEVIRLLIRGEKNAVIAEKLCVSENTVKYHLKNIYQKLDVGSRSQAINRLSEYQQW